MHFFACLPETTPYNAPHIDTADVNHFTQIAGSVEEKNPEIRG
ncbi:hypothetical protein ESCAB7627_3058 [Escherichia albertii TW07627]|uniref:Uncharacterized protein n=1 Tax=Escherichia albertii (strain TW07627) TaxID=502347 RepID=A0ABC9NN18_ESCAT|nr:hypothetical protein ESCAB7627_3058 [Escherichia albertii TW07627]